MGNDPTFDQNAKDFDRLSEVVCLRSFGLTVPSVAEMKVLNLSTLFSEIVADTEFKSRNRNCTVQPLIEGDICVRGNGDLLRSGIEDAIRNAVRYPTPPASHRFHTL